VILISLLGAQMGPSAFFHDRSKYCHNGGMASPLVPRRWLGVQQRDDGPLERSPEMAALQGKSLRVRDPYPLGAGMDSTAFFHTRKKYCHDGGIAFAR
jgi:hypothetical protein